ncbi:atlastin-3-like [Amblyomma americanum]
MMVAEEGSGHEVQILRVEDHCIQLDEEALQRVLLDDRIKNKHVAVISLAGGFRKGKSFMLSFFLRFLYNLGSPVWLGSPSEPLRGFKWRGGCDRHTTGILIWREVFLVKTPEHGELAVLLMDTQGMHDDQSTVKESAAIFALTTMLSSVLVYNVSQNIQEDDLQYLELFTEYGRLAEQHMFGKPFQKLLILVRDWYHIRDAEYGASGGRKLLEKRLKVKENQQPQLQQLRKYIDSFFTEIGCFLMPHPGFKVAQARSFDGRLSDIEEDFKCQLLHLVPSILSPENLIPKEINGQKVTCQQLIIYMTTYVHMFKGNSLPEPKTVFQAMAEGNHQAAVSEAVQQYSTNMIKRCGGQKKSRKKLDEIHNQEKARAQDMFHNTRKMGGEELSQCYLQKLSKEIDRWYGCFASGMTKTHILETTTCKVAEGVAATGFTTGATVFYLAGLPIHGTACAVTAIFVASLLIGTCIYGYCVRGLRKDTYDSNGKDDKAGSKGMTGKGFYHQNNTLDKDFLGRCFNETSKENKMKNKLETIGSVKDKYMIKMEEICGTGKPFVKPDELHDLHCRYRQTALNTFAKACKTAGMKPPQGYLDELAQEIDEAFDNFSNKNASKMGFWSRALARLRAMFKKSSTPYFHFKES